LYLRFTTETQPVNFTLYCQYPKQDEEDRKLAELEAAREADPQYDQKMKEAEMRRNISSYIQHQKSRLVDDELEWRQYQEKIREIQKSHKPKHQTNYIRVNRTRIYGSPKLSFYKTPEQAVQKRDSLQNVRLK
jgi:hypothetical protein